MPNPQAHITADPGRHSAVLVFSVKNPEEAKRVVAALGDYSAVTESRSKDAHTACTIALGADFARSVWSVVPRELTSFSPIEGPTHTAPATGGDVLVHLHCDRRDILFADSRNVRVAFGETAELIEETQGFRYLDSRDLTGFIDGTENPAEAERADTCFVGEEDEDFAGGSYVLAQRYVHDLTAWSLLADADQEKIIGRTKDDSVELAEDVLPDTAHISRVVIEEDGKELEIFRKSFPYGTTSEAGLYFIAYNRTPSTYRKMLERMFGLDDSSEQDELMNYSKAVSGAIFFAPSMERLEELRK